MEKFINEKGTFTSTDCDSECNETPSRSVHTPRTSHNSEFELKEFYEKLMNLFAGISTKIDNVEIKFMSQFDNITYRLNALENGFRALQNKIQFVDDNPISTNKIMKSIPAWNTVEEFDEILRKLEDDDFNKKLTKEMTEIGGPNSQQTTKNILKRCLNPSLWKSYTLKGQTKEKDNFSETLFYKCIIGKYF